MKTVYVGLFGFFGAITRYLIGLALNGQTFPLGTLTVNLVGCFFLGIIYEYGAKKLPKHSDILGAFGTGFIGAFTTFSSFSVEAVQLLIIGNILAGISYITISLIFGILGIMLAMYISDKIGKVEL
ncbi:MAG: fluoride efflux transporter CrcB [Anaerovoracaceae bacterium]